MNWQETDKQNLVNVILALEGAQEAQAFLRDLLTEAEITEFAKRWQAARMLDQKVAYSQIVDSTKLSSTTVARVSKWLNNGMGGYRAMLNKLHHHNNTPMLPSSGLL